MSIVFTDVRFSYGTLTILDGLSHSFEGNGRYCLMGPSGSGKTTLLKLACGLLQPKGGTIASSIKKPSFVFQEDRLLPWYTAKKNIALVSSVSHAQTLLEQLGLIGFENVLPEALSGGMRGRVALGRALAAESDGYFFDEPLKGLDADMREDIAALINEHTRGKLFLTVTHNPQDAQLFSATPLYLEGPPLRIR